jgi:hypothetical protein
MSESAIRVMTRNGLIVKSETDLELSRQFLQFK